MWDCEDCITAQVIFSCSFRVCVFVSVCVNIPLNIVIVPTNKVWLLLKICIYRKKSQLAKWNCLLFIWKRKVKHKQTDEPKMQLDFFCVFITFEYKCLCEWGNVCQILFRLEIMWNIHAICHLFRKNRNCARNSGKNTKWKKLFGVILSNWLMSYSLTIPNT